MNNTVLGKTIVNLRKHRKQKINLDMCLKTYKRDPVKFLSAPRSAWPAALKNTKLKLDLLTDIYMLLMVEKGVRGGVCHSIYRSS